MRAALLLGLALIQTQGTQTSVEDVLRARVQQYFDAQAREDAGAVLAFWSQRAAAPPSRATLDALFASGDDVFQIDVRRIEIDGDRARVQLQVDRTRTMAADAAKTTRRGTTAMVEEWVREEGEWRLVRERPLADDLADTLLAASSDRWEGILRAENPVTILGALRYAIASRGSAFAAARQYEKALVPFGVLREIGRVTGNRVIEIDALQNLGNTWFFLHHYEQATEAYAAELALAREAHSAQAEAAALSGGAMVAYARGDYTPALEGYRAALAIYERAVDNSAIGRTLVSVGNVQYLQGEYDLAAASYRRAIGLLSSVSDVPSSALAWRGVGRVYAAQGDLASALVAHRHALDDARSRSARPEIATDEESVGEVEFRLGNTAEARTAFDAARELFEVLGDTESAGRLYGDIGLTEVVAERFDAAVTAYTESRKRYERVRQPAGIGHAWVGIGFSEAGRGRFDDAIDAYRIAIGIFDAGGRKEDAGRAWLGLSLAHFGAGDAPASLDDAARVQRIADAVHSPDLEWRARVRSGEALRRLHRLDEARSAFDQAIASIQRIAAGAAMSADARTQLEDSPSAYAGLAFTLAELGDPEGALLAAEQRKAHAIRIMLAPFERDISRGATPAEMNAERTTLRAIISLGAQLHAERAAPQPDRARIERLQQQLTEATADRDRQQHALYVRRPDLRLWRGLRPPMSIDDLTPALDDPATLAVHYVVADDELLVIAASRAPRTTDDGLFATQVTTAIVPVNRHDLAVAIGRALEPASLADRREWESRARPIASLLLAPITPRLAGHTHLAIAPDDLLWKIPFAALPLTNGELYAAADVTYTSSLRTLAVRRADRDEPGVAFIAAPALTDDLRAQLTASLPGWKPEDSAAVLENVHGQAARYGETAQMATGAGATQEAASEALHNDAVVQIDARVQLSGATPMFSSALLAPSPSNGGLANDGRWELREWFDAEARGTVLVLPDPSGLAVPAAGAAMTALDWASAAAGTSGVILSWPPAGAFAVASLLRDFHAARAAGVAPAEAWHASAATARADPDAPPAAWAGLRVLGRIR